MTEIPEQVNKKFEFFKAKNNLREIDRNEIVFDLDDRENGFLAVQQIQRSLYGAGINFEVWYAEGQKSPHVHIKNINGLESLSSEQLKKYKEIFLKKYCPRQFHKYLDLSLCSHKHLIAEENKKHFKYETIKTLILHLNKQKQNYAEPELIDQAKKIVEQAKQRVFDVNKQGITAKIIQRISIVEKAKSFGLDVNANNMALCVFHRDTKPSLKFYDDQGRFYCFGCRKNGNLVDFIYEMRHLKNAN